MTPEQHASENTSQPSSLENQALGPVEYATATTDGLVEKGASYYQPVEVPASWDPPSAALVTEPAPSAPSEAQQDNSPSDGS